MNIGVLALQGAFIEHQKILEGLGAKVLQVRLPSDLENLHGLIIPGGESTTIGKLAEDFGLMEPLQKFARSHAVWGYLRRQYIPFQGRFPRTTFIRVDGYQSGAECIWETG